MASSPMPASATNLPVPLTSLVGRDVESGAVTALLLSENTRLLTLTGPGGVGKTRLSLRVAGAVAAEFGDGVWFVNLAQISEPQLVLPAIAQTLGLHEVGDTSYAERLTAFLRDKRLLLVLDNFEQVVAAAPRLAELLARCAGLTLLVTSRNSLHVAGEQEFPVAPLPLPDEAATDVFVTAAASDAVRLFVERARAVRPDFALTPENAPAIAAICRLLDGLPLAIELAAARTRVLPPAALAARLERRLPLLTGAGSDVPGRLRTMRDAITWSYELLSADEQRLFCQLGVFSGGFDLEAAERVTGLPEIETIDRLTSLIDKSLLLFGEGTHGAPRYSMLETIREFGQERLADLGLDDAAQRAHAMHFLALAERSALPGEMQGPGARYWTDRFETEEANSRLALAYFRETGEAELALRLATPFAMYWFTHGPLRDGIERLRETLDLDENVDPTLRARGLSWLALLHWVAGEGAKAIEYCVESEQIATAAGDRIGMGLALYFRSLAAGWNTVNPAEGVPYAERALALAEGQEPPPWFIPFAIGDMGQMLIFAGDRERGIALLEDALALHRTMGHDFGAGMKLMMLALNAQELGDELLAVQRYREGLALLWGVRHALNLNLAMTGLAALAAERGQYVPATRLLGMVQAIQERTGASVQAPWVPLLERAEWSCRAALDAERFAADVESGRRLPVGDAVAAAMTVADALLDQASAARGASPTDALGLTARETQVLRLLAAGRSNAEIADLLFMSPRTASTHVSHIYAKLDVTSRAEAVAWAHRHLAL